MKYIELVFEYLFKFQKGKRFFVTLLVASPLTLLAAFFMPLDKLFGWFTTHTGQYESYGTLLRSSFASVNAVWYVVMFVISVLTIASITGMMNFCLRTGKFRIGNLLRGINDNFFSALFVSLFFMLLVLLSQLVSTFFLFPIGLIDTPWLVIMLSIVILALFGVIIALIATSLLMWLPIMTFYGLPPHRAMIPAIQKAQGDFGRLFAAILIPVIVTGILGFSAALIKIYAISVILSYLSYSFLVVYTVTLSILVFFDTEGLDREDTPREYLYKKYR